MDHDGARRSKEKALKGMSRRLTRLRTTAGWAWKCVCDTGLGGHAGTYMPHNQLRHALQESQEYLQSTAGGVGPPGGLQHDGEC